MITWLKEFLYNEAMFLSVLRIAVIFIGEGMRSGAIPTGIDHGGTNFGPIVEMMSAFITKAPNGKGTRDA